jgi:hypothetical protein
LNPKLTRIKTMATKAYNVIVSKNGEKEVSTFNVSTVSTVHAADVDASGSALQDMCYNLLAGTADPALFKALEDGGLPKLLPHYANDKAFMSRLRKCLRVTPAALRAAWASHCRAAKKVHGINLSALAKALGSEKAPSDRMTLKQYQDRLRGAINNVPNWERDGFDWSDIATRALYDMLVDLTKDAEAPAVPEAETKTPAKKAA